MIELHWSAAPSSIRILLFYLSLVLIWVAIRALRLSWRLFSFYRKRVSIEDLRSESVSPDSFADCAFANRINRVISNDSAPSDRSRGAAAGNETVHRALRRADIKFRYLFGTYDGEIAAVRKLLWLSALICSFLFVSGAFPTWREFFYNSKLTSFGALLEAMPRLFDWASLALGAWAILYAIWAFLDGILAQRRVFWEYLYSRTSSELSTEPWTSNKVQPSSKER